MNTNLTSQRKVGAFPVSIATSIALEYLLGVKSEANPEPKPKSVSDYKEFWINIKTLYRNIMGSLDKTASLQVLDNELADTLLQEMEIINGIIGSNSFNTTNVVFYISNYQGLEILYPMAQLRTDNTERQKLYSALMENTIKTMLKKGRPESCDVRIFPNKLKPSGEFKTLILTHIPYDLVAHAQFGSLTLIESHTGAFKTRDRWYSKYYEGKELSMIPFMEGLLPIFGDNETFRPLNKSAREEIIEIAKKYHWSAVTTREKVLYGINTLKNPFLKEAARSFFH